MTTSASLTLVEPAKKTSSPLPEFHTTSVAPRHFTVANVNIDLPITISFLFLN